MIEIEPNSLIEESDWNYFHDAVLSCTGLLSGLGGLARPSSAGRPRIASVLDHHEIRDISEVAGVTRGERRGVLNRPGRNP